MFVLGNAFVTSAVMAVTPGALLVPLVLAASSVVEKSHALSTVAPRAASANPSKIYQDCYRQCEAGGTPRVCKYVFFEEVYSAVNEACGNCTAGVTEDCAWDECIPLDGIERPVMSINRMVPGPAIHVGMVGQADTLHWHGMLHRDTPYMDGVSGVTQCPVSSGQTFQYRFLAEAAGTYFYHSHNGINKVNGIQGRMVFREPKESDAHGLLYDEDLREHEMLLMDWMHSDAMHVFPGLRRPHGQEPDTILINGKGNYQLPDGTFTLTPVEEFVVKRGRRYRFRIINGGWGSCSIGLRVLDHKLSVIATDARNVRPTVVDTIYSWSGERYDFVLEANQPGAMYWVHAFTGGFCLDSGIAVDQVAVLRYSDAPADAVLPPDSRPSVRKLPPLGTELNSARCGDGAGSLCVTQLLSLEAPRAELVPDRPQVQVVIAVGFHTYTREELFKSGPRYPKYIYAGTNQAGTLNNIAFQAAASPPLTQPGASPLCERCQDANATFCCCTHVIRLPKDKVVDIILVDQAKAGEPVLAHPLHLHGYSFQVRGMGSLRHIPGGAERVRYAKEHARQLATNTATPPYKDTIMLPSGGYALLRMLTDNPGMWFFHCHFQYHMASGMEAIIQVGEFEDFVKPPANFPTCGNFML